MREKEKTYFYAFHCDRTLFRHVRFGILKREIKIKKNITRYVFTCPALSF